jgi:hypothetical protein
MPIKDNSRHNNKQMQGCESAKKPQRAVRMCTLTDDTYYNSGDDEFVFSPDAPDAPALTPVKARATPYTYPPTECTINFQTGTVRCVANDSRGGLYPVPPPSGLWPPRRSQSPVRRVPVNAPLGQALFSTPAYQNFNYVSGYAAVPERPDSPLNRILTRQPTGPWRLVGAAVVHSGNAPPKERTMMVYAQSVDAARDRYNYRVVDNNNVPLDVGSSVRWKSDGDVLHVPGYPHAYTLQLYNQYQV